MNPLQKAIAALTAKRDIVTATKNDECLDITITSTTETINISTAYSEELEDALDIQSTTSYKVTDLECDETEVLTVNSDELKDAIKQVEHAISTEEFALGNLAIAANETDPTKLAAVMACDGGRMALCGDINLIDRSTYDYFLVPRKILKKLHKLIAVKGATVQIIQNSQTVFFIFNQNDNYAIASYKKPKVSYPAIKHLIPATRQFPNSVEIPRFSLDLSKKCDFIELDFKNDRVWVNPKKEDKDDEHFFNLPASVSEEIYVSLNSKYFQQAIAATQGQITLYAKDWNQPVIITSDRTTHLIMPVQLRQINSPL